MMQPVQSDERLRCTRSFVTDGFLHVSRVLSVETVQAWAERFATGEFLNQIFADLFDRGHTLFPEHHREAISPPEQDDGLVADVVAALPTTLYAMGQGVRHGYKEIVMRSPGRYEISIDDAVMRHEIVSVLREHLPFVPSLLSPEPHHQQHHHQPHLTWDTVQIVNVSLVVSTPGAPAQAWHSDGCHVDLHHHLPCHCLNIFVPLTAVTVTNGPTELRPESQYYTRDLARLFLAARARRAVRPTVAPTLDLGDCLVFDYRILHRGLANQEAESADPDVEPSRNRTILVVAVAQPWFKDVVNFPSVSVYSEYRTGESCLPVPIQCDNPKHQTQMEQSQQEYGIR